MKTEPEQYKIDWYDRDPPSGIGIQELGLEVSQERDWASLS